MSVMAPPWRSCGRHRQRLARLALRSSHSKFSERRMSRPRSRHSMIPSVPFMSVPILLTLPNRIRINTLALSARLPTIYVLREFVEAGGLMSYGPNFLDLYRRSASYVDKILRGTKPADIPVEQPTKFDFIINLLTARALRLTLPPTLLARADEVIE